MLHLQVIGGRGTLFNKRARPTPYPGDSDEERFAQPCIPFLRTPDCSLGFR